MRKPLLLLLIVASVTLVALGVILLVRDTSLQTPPAVTTPGSTGDVARITVDQLNRELQGGAPPIVWEFVSETQFANGHLPGAQLMTFETMPSAVQGLDRQQPIVTLCT